MGCGTNGGKTIKLESSKRNKAAFDLAKEFEEKDILINQKIGNNEFEVIKKIYEKKKIRLIY